MHAVFVNEVPAGGRKSKGEGAEKHDRRASREQLISLATWLGGGENVSIHLHMLESLAEGLLVRFLCAYRIFCLILGAGDRQSLQYQSAWVDKLRHRLKGERGWYLPAFWSVLVQPGEEPDLEYVFTKYKDEAWSAADSKVLAGRLQQDLNEFIQLEE